jgi:hypothetical protein
MSLRMVLDPGDFAPSPGSTSVKKYEDMSLWDCGESGSHDKNAAACDRQGNASDKGHGRDTGRGSLTGTKWRILLMKRLAFICFVSSYLHIFLCTRTP